MEKLKLVLDNLVFSLQKAGGATVYWSELLKKFDTDEDIELTVIERPDSSTNLLRSSYEINSKVIDSEFTNLRLDELSRLKVKDADIVHSSYFRFASGDHAKNISTIHDFISAKYYKGFVKAFSLWQMRRAIGHSKGIICISESTKKDMNSIFPQSKSIATKVIHHGVNHKDFYIDSGSIKCDVDNTVCFIGARNRKYKNFEMAVRSVSQTEGVRLIIIGADLSRGEIDFLDSLIPGRYEIKVFPSSAEIREIFNLSLCLLYLSEYEGFGMPVLEAMASGLPVIAMNKSSIPEVAGGAAILLNESSDKKVSDSIKLLKENKSAFYHYRHSGIENAGRFSWEKAIEETKDFYFDIQSNNK